MSRILVPINEMAPLVRLVSDASQGAEPSKAEIFKRYLNDCHTLSAASLADCFRALRALSQQVGEETFSLSARPMMAGTAELVFSRAAGAATLGDAMREIAHAYNVLHGGNYNQVELRGRTLVYVLHDDRFPYTRPRDAYLHFSLECALIFIHSALCELADADLASSVRQVSTRRVKSGKASGALGFWRAPIHYDTGVYAIAYDAGIAGRSLDRRRRAMAPDLAVHNRIISLIESQEVAGERESAADAVRRAFGDALYEQPEIARRLGVSTATLRRRLADEGLSFRDLHHQALKEEAQVKLTTLKDVTAVAELLGFSDRRSFTRAFTGWTGLTPSVLLQQVELLSS